VLVACEKFVINEYENEYENKNEYENENEHENEYENENEYGFERLGFRLKIWGFWGRRLV